MGKKVDLTGQRFGRLEVMRLSDNRKRGNKTWLCQCSCGNEIGVTTNELKSGRVISCGCARGSKLDLRGKRFGRLTVLNQTDERYCGLVIWKCQCDCGKCTNTSSNKLMSGRTKSCGCLLSENLEGKRYGKLLVIRRTDERSNNQVVWECLCDCGNYKNVITGRLGSGTTKSCGCSRPSGVYHHNYNPNLTSEERLKGRYVLSGSYSRTWSKEIMKRDNYTCQICNQHGGNLNAHHLNGWNAFPEQRFDLDNGVTLCTDCHKEFHSQYGYGDNTREQFDEYAASKTLVLN